MESETCETGSWSLGAWRAEDGLLGTSGERSSMKQSKRFGFALFLPRSCLLKGEFFALGHE